MIVFDMRTMVFSYMLTSFICVLFVVLLWRQNRNNFSGTAFWVVDFVFQAVAIYLIIMRGAIPDWISMILASTLVVAGAILGFIGLERFLGKQGPQIHNYLLLTLFVFVHSYFSLIQPNLEARNLNLAVALLLICFQSVWLAWHRVEPGLRSLTFGVGLVNFLYCLLSSIRIAHFFIAPQDENDYFKPALFEALVLASYQVLLILLTYSFVLMANRRLLAQFETQKEKFAKAFHSAPYAIMLTRHSDGTIIDVNETFALVTGYDRTEVLGKKTKDLYMWERDADRAAVLGALLETGGLRGMELSFRKKNGERITGLLSAEVITIDGEKSILSSIGDITERKHSEEQLQKLSHAVEQSPAATVITDINGRFEYVNPKFLEVTGYTREELIGKTPAVIKSGLTPLRVYEDLWRTILSGAEWRGEMQNRKKNGDLYWEHEIISSIKNAQGEIVNFIAVKEDITERRQTEEALQLKRARLLEAERELVSAREALADADRLESVGRLAAGVAHEVKNPLTIIRLGVDYLSKLSSQESGKEVFADIQGAIERADNVIMDLLDFSKQRQFVLRETNINRVIDKAIHLVGHEIKRRNISIVRDRTDPTAHIDADPDRLVQVFVNLLSNAAQAIGRDGGIEVVTRSMHLSERDLARSEAGVFDIGEEVIAVDIRDNGPGFPTENSKNLFEPFYTTKPMGEGSGLGLAVSRNIVIMHRGSISISNRSEGGVSALLMFRAAREHATHE